MQQKDFDAIRKNLKADKLGWNIDEEIDFADPKSLEKACNKVGAFADKVTAWGDGTVYRELMNSDDLAAMSVDIINQFSPAQIGEFVNIGAGEDIQMKDLLALVKKIVGFEGKIEFDPTKPNGVFRKLLDTTKMQSLGIPLPGKLEDGIRLAYKDFLENPMRAER